MKFLIFLLLLELQNVQRNPTQPNPIMKTLLLIFLILSTSIGTAFAQSKTSLKAGLGYVQSGDGDIPGSMLIAGVQNRVTKWIGYDLLASGSRMERTQDFGQGYTLNEKSNGISLEGNINLFINFWRFTFYPSIGPVLRYAHERHPNFYGIEYDWSGNIITFESDMRDEYQFQYGYVMGLNLDGRITENITVGVRASVQDYHTGQILPFLGFTIRKSGWPF